MRHVESPQIPTRCDVVVIGAGMAGLSCATYLARGGMNVLLVEKHYSPGGCCSSFERGSYYFDAGAHYLSSCRPEGQVGRLIRDLGLKLELLHCNPSDAIYASGRRVFLRPMGASRMSEGFEQAFPCEAAQTRKFWHYLEETGAAQLYADLRHLTFRELLDQFFSDGELKDLLSVPLGNIGLPSYRASALTAAFLFREYLLDGGYYPRGGMQRLPDSLIERFQELGGHVAFLTSAERIRVNATGCVQSVSVKIMGKHHQEVVARFVVATCDPFLLEMKLLADEDRWRIALADQIRQRAPSISCFMVHLGVSMDLASASPDRCNVWYSPGSDVDAYYQGILDGNVAFGHDGFVICSIPTFHDPSLLPNRKHSIHAIVGAPFKDQAFWDAHKEQLADDVVMRLERFLPGISERIEVRQIATPQTIVKYTGNHLGAMYGWAALPEHVGNDRLGEGALGIEGLYLAGHWTGLPTGYSGIPTVVGCGRRVAEKILRANKSGCPLVAFGYSPHSNGNLNDIGDQTGKITRTTSKSIV